MLFAQIYKKKIELEKFHLSKQLNKKKLKKK